MKVQGAGRSDGLRGAHRPLLPQEVGHAREHIHIAALQDGEGRQRAIVHVAVDGLQLACMQQACLEEVKQQAIIL